MKNLEEFLSRFKLIEDPKKNKINIIKVLETLLGMSFQENSIKIKDNVVVISVEPAIKSYLFTRKEFVLGEIQKILSKNNIKIIFK